MRVLFFSHYELERICRFWDLYVANIDGRVSDSTFQRESEEELRFISSESRDVFLSALDGFEIRNEEFTVRVAPDDRGILK